MSAEIPTHAEIAAACRKAKYDLITGQISAYTAFGRQFTMQNLNELTDVEQYHQQLADEASSGPSVTTADLRSRG